MSWQEGDREQAKQDGREIEVWKSSSREDAIFLLLDFAPPLAPRKHEHFALCPRILQPECRRPTVILLPHVLSLRLLERLSG